MRSVNKIIIHCSDSPPTMDIGVKEIDKWHKERGWSGIGYHFVIRRDGTIEQGRPCGKIGAHARGHNRNSIGICLVGGRSGTFDFHRSQLESLERLTFDVALGHMYEGYIIEDGLEVGGHCDYTTGTKTCPNFNVKAWSGAH